MNLSSIKRGIVRATGIEYGEIDNEFALVFNRVASGVGVSRLEQEENLMLLSQAVRSRGGELDVSLYNVTELRRSFAVGGKYKEHLEVYTGRGSMAEMTAEGLSNSVRMESSVLDRGDLNNIRFIGVLREQVMFIENLLNEVMSATVGNMSEVSLNHMNLSENSEIRNILDFEINKVISRVDEMLLQRYHVDLLSNLNPAVGLFHYANNTRVYFEYNGQQDLMEYALHGSSRVYIEDYNNAIENYFESVFNILGGTVN